MDEEYKKNLKRCCLRRWHTTIDKEELARQVVDAEIGGRIMGWKRKELENLTVEEDEELYNELLQHLLLKG